MVVVGGDRGDLGVGDGDLRIVRSELQVLLVFLRAVVAPRQCEDQRVVALDLTELAYRVGVVRQRVIGEDPTGFDIRTHGMTASLRHDAEGDHSHGDQSPLGSVVCPTSMMWPSGSRM